MVFYIIHLMFFRYKALWLLFGLYNFCTNVKNVRLCNTFNFITQHIWSFKLPYAIKNCCFVLYMIQCTVRVSTNVTFFQSNITQILANTTLLIIVRKWQTHTLTMFKNNPNRQPDRLKSRDHLYQSQQVTFTPCLF